MLDLEQLLPFCFLSIQLSFNDKDRFEQFNLLKFLNDPHLLTKFQYPLKFQQLHVLPEQFLQGQLLIIIHQSKT